MDEIRLNAIETRIDKLEVGQKEMADRQNKIENEQAETRVYVKQIFERIDDLKSFIKVNPPKSSNKEWIDLVKWIIGGTIFVIVASLFTKGGF